jgi:zinc/manganese transport system ATP-binding protein
VSAGASSGALVELRQARLGYGGNTILEGVDLAVGPRDFLVVVGPNGSGKTTLLRGLLGVAPLLGGERSCRALLGYAPQRSTLDPIFPFRAWQVVEMGLLATEGLSAAQRRERVDEVMGVCGISSRAEAPFRDLSGGQKQRVLVARALVSEPQVLVLDEPTNDLDLRGETEIMGLLERLHVGGRAIVMVTHLLHLVARHGDRIAFVHDGRLEVGTPEEQLTEQRLSALYGVAVDVGTLGEIRTISARPSPASEEA